MNEIQKNLSLWLYVFYLSTIILLVSGVVFLLSSCTVEELHAPKRPGSGRMVTVQFALDNQNYHDNEVVTHSAVEHWKEAGGIANAAEQAFSHQKEANNCHSEWSEAESKNLRSFDCAQDDISTTLWMTESAYSNNLDVETVVVPIGDGLAMVATLEITQMDNVSRTTTSGINPGTLLRIVAYEDGVTYQDHADYYVGIDNTLLSVDGRDLIIPEGDYKFVAYGYNNNTSNLPSKHTDNISDIDPDNDLIWGCFPTNGTKIYMGENANTNISIMMSHMFSKVSFLGTTATMPAPIPNISKISNVSISGKKANLTVSNGSFESNDDTVPYMFSNTSFTISSDLVVSAPIMVHAGGKKSTYLIIDTLVLNGTKTFTNLSAAFDKELKSGFSYMFKVNFKYDKGVEQEKGEGIMGGRPPGNIQLYVGAFWKSHQTGERLIHIRRPQEAPWSDTYYHGFGVWKATVISGADWIVLDTLRSTDPNIGWRVDVTPSPNESLVDNGNDPDFDTKHAVNSTATTVFGTWLPPGHWGIKPGHKADTVVYFRIGLRSQYKPTPERPARYGAVLISFANVNPLWQTTMRYSTDNADYAYQARIWIRQGEDADYLFSNDDPITSTPTYTRPITARTVTKRFSPYNLTAEALDAAVLSQADSGNEQITGNRSKFVDYPSQKGAYFQWSGMTGANTRVRYAWNPYTTLTATWNANADNRFWDLLKDTNETCPPGYHRPTDGSTSAAQSATAISNSEIRQSLFLEPKTGIGSSPGTSNTGNSVWGYIADGFFDRRKILNLETVSSTNRNIAHTGRLFYNSIPTSNRYGASIFFPTGGTRRNTDGLIQNSGKEADYLTSSSSATTTGIFMHLFNGYGVGQHASMWQTSKATGYPIRCVKN